MPIQDFFVNQGDANKILDSASRNRTSVSSAYSLYLRLGPPWLAESLQNSQTEEGSTAARNESVDDTSSITPDWEPLEIDRADPELQSTIEALSKLEEIVRSDNGYAENFPHERTEVLAGLRAGLEILNTASLMTYTGAQAYVLLPLYKLLARFPTETIIGQAAGTAKAAFGAWAVTKGVTWLEAAWQALGSGLIKATI